MERGRQREGGSEADCEKNKGKIRIMISLLSKMFTNKSMVNPNVRRSDNDPITCL